MEKSSIFSNLLPPQLRIPLLALALFPHLMILSLFSMNSTFSASYLDVEPDDLQFLFTLAYAAITCSLFIHVRFFQYFSVKNYLLLMTSLNIIVLGAMTLTHNAQVLFALRFIQGPLSLWEGCILLPVLMQQIKSDHSRLIAYSILYTYMLTGDKIGTTLVTYAIENFNHNTMLYTVMMVHTAALFIYLLLFNHNRLYPYKPLYQLQIPALILLVVCLVSGTYFFIYGKQYYWFESPRIVAAFVLMSVAGALFIAHQLTAKRPVYHFQVLTSERVRVGVFLFLTLYIIRAAMNPLYQVMQSVWHWPWKNILALQYFNVAGVLLGTIGAVLAVVRKTPPKYIFGSAFFLLGVSYYWISLILYPDIPPTAIKGPFFINGVALGTLFTPLVLYMLGSVQPNLSGNASLTGTATRFWGSTVGYSLIQNVLLYLTTKYQYDLSATMPESSPTFQNHWHGVMGAHLSSHLYEEAQQLAAGDIQQLVSQQALLLSTIDIFTVLAWVSFTVSAMSIVYFAVKKKVQLLSHKGKIVAA